MTKRFSTIAGAVALALISAPVASGAAGTEQAPGALSFFSEISFAAAGAAEGAEPVQGFLLPVLPAGNATVPADDRFEGGAVLHDNAAIAAAFNAKGRKAVIDRGHETEWHSGAVALGWIHELRVGEDGGLYAAAEMTAEGAEMLKARKFGFTSPTLRGGRVEGSRNWQANTLKALALTNNPALEMSATFSGADGDDIEALQSSLATLSAERDTLAKAIETAGTETAALAAQVATLSAERDTLTASVAALSAERDTLSSQITTLAAERDAATASLAAFKDQDFTRQVSEAVDAHIRDGKGTPAQREHLAAFARVDIEKFRAFSAAAVAVVAGTAPGALPAAAPGDGAGAADENSAVFQYLKRIGGDQLVTAYRSANKPAAA